MPQNFYACFNHFDIKQSIALTNKNYTSLYSLVHKEYGNLYRRINETKVTGTYLQCGKNEAFHHDFFVETDFVSG